MTSPTTAVHERVSDQMRLIESRPASSGHTPHTASDPASSGHTQHTDSKPRVVVRETE